MWQWIKNIFFVRKAQGLFSSTFKVLPLFNFMRSGVSEFRKSNYHSANQQWEGEWESGWLICILESPWILVSTLRESTGSKWYKLSVLWSLIQVSSLMASCLVQIITYDNVMNRERVAISCRTISLINKKVRMIKKHSTIIYFLPIIDFVMFKNQKYGGVLYCWINHPVARFIWGCAASFINDASFLIHRTSTYFKVEIA